MESLFFGYLIFLFFLKKVIHVTSYSCTILTHNNYCRSLAGLKNKQKKVELVGQAWLGTSSKNLLRTILGGF